MTTMTTLTGGTDIAQFTQMPAAPKPFKASDLNKCLTASNDPKKNQEDKEKKIKKLINELLNNHDIFRDSTTIQAAGELANMKARSAVKPLIQILQSNRDEYVIAAAAEALGIIGDPSALKALISALWKYQNNKDIGAAAAEAIGLFGNLEPGTKSLKFPRQYCNDAVNVLSEVLRKNNPGDVQEKAAQALGRIRASSSHALLLETLRKSDSKKVRAAAAEALGDLVCACYGEQNKTSAEYLTMSLHDPCWEAREGAAKGIAKLIRYDSYSNFNKPLLKDELISSTKNDESVNVRAAAARALVCFFDDAVIDSLIAALNAEDTYRHRGDIWLVHKAAAEALGGIFKNCSENTCENQARVEKTIKALETALHGDVAPDTRMAVAAAFYRLAESPVAKDYTKNISLILITGLIEDDEKSVQDSIIQALKNICALDKTGEIRKYVNSTLTEKLGQAEGDALRNKLRRAMNAINKR